MDRRYAAYKTMMSETLSHPMSLEATNQKEVEVIAQMMREGIEGEFWAQLKAGIDALIFKAEGRFLDTLAKNYDEYVEWWSRRQALIHVLTLPDDLCSQKHMELTRSTNAT